MNAATALKILESDPKELGDLVDEYRRSTAMPQGPATFDEFLTGSAEAIAHNTNRSMSWLQGEMAASEFLRGLKVLKEMSVTSVEVIGESWGGCFPLSRAFDKRWMKGVLFTYPEGTVQFNMDTMFPYGFWSVKNDAYRVGWDLETILTNGPTVETLIASFDAVVREDRQAVAVGHLCGKVFDNVAECREALLEELS